MKRTIPALLLVLLLLTGCGGSAPSNNAAMDSMTQSAGSVNGSYDYGWGAETAPEMPKAEADSLSNTNTNTNAAVQSANIPSSPSAM